jgi:hypothetical protein
MVRSLSLIALQFQPLVTPAKALRTAIGPRQEQIAHGARNASIAVIEGIQGGNLLLPFRAQTGASSQAPGMTNCAIRGRCFNVST